MKKERTVNKNILICKDCKKEIKTGIENIDNFIADSNSSLDKLTNRNYTYNPHIRCSGEIVKNGK